ncbi:MAG: chromate transporter [Eubacteriales bacterium]|nr:chromate transporter [Eubacteriales bacterium]
MILLELFIAFFQIGLFSVGGGYAAMPFIQNLAVERYQWLQPDTFADLISIAEMTPGPIALNSATFIGIHLTGFLGALVATIACIIPSLIVVGILSYVYKKYRELSSVKIVLSSLRPVILALILSAGLSLLLYALFQGLDYRLERFHLQSALIALFAFALLRIKKPNPIWVLLISGVLGLVLPILL